MTVVELKKKVRKLIAQAQTEKAIELMIEWARENNQQETERESILLMGRLSGLNNDKRIGIISNTDASIQQNRITNSIMGILEMIGGLFQESVLDKPNSKKKKILMLTANPATTALLNLDQEYAVINQKLQQQHDFFNIILKKAVSGTEFKEFTQNEKPDILHFSGHGNKGKYAGIVVQNEDKNTTDSISIDGLNALFEFLDTIFRIQVVVLNACYTQEQAATISQYVDYVIGTNIAIGDAAACAFSSGFYFQLANDADMDVEHAFASGRTEAIMKGAKKQNFVIYRHGILIEI